MLLYFAVVRSTSLIEGGEPFLTSAHAAHSEDTLGERIDSLVAKALERHLSQSWDASAEAMRQVNTPDRTAVEFFTCFC